MTVGADEWIAGPSAPSRIEGIAIEWLDKPAGVDLRYAVNSTKSTPKTSGVGTFVGTRGHARPITGVTLELFGPERRRPPAACEALFLGSPTTRTTGKRIVMSGVTGREPLVGLRLRVEPVAKAHAAVLTTGAREGRSSGGVRVFRSRTSRGEATL